MDEDMDESLRVMLVRMEGKVDLQTQRLVDVLPRIARLEDTVPGLLMSVQSLTQSAEARARANEAAEKAREDARVETARALALEREAREQQNSSQWSPIAKFTAFILGAAALWGFLEAVIPGGLG